MGTSIPLLLRKILLLALRCPLPAPVWKKKCSIQCSHGITKLITMQVPASFLVCSKRILKSLQERSHRKFVMRAPRHLKISLIDADLSNEPILIRPSEFHLCHRNLKIPDDHPDFESKSKHNLAHPAFQKAQRR